MNKVRKTDEDPKFIPYCYLSEFSLDLIIAIANNREFKVSYHENKNYYKNVLLTSTSVYMITVY